VGVATDQDNNEASTITPTLSDVYFASGYYQSYYTGDYIPARKSIQTQVTDRLPLLSGLRSCQVARRLRHLVPALARCWASNADKTETGHRRSRSIWTTGFFTGGDDAIDGEVWSATAGASGCVTATGDTCPLIRLGDYDYVTLSINDPGSPGSFPNSFFLSSAPAYFGASGANCTYAWPWVNSTAATKVVSPTGPGSCTSYSGLPAKARIDAGTPFAQP
jgi:hypothetical protein